MLVIDNENLEKLKEFGFEPRYSEKTGKIIKYIIEDERNVVRYIDTNPDYNPYWELILNRNELLYDLIQAGLVKKI